MKFILGRRVPTRVAWAASGAINLELSPVPFTITGMVIDLYTDITTTTSTNYNDYWDRMISRLGLSGTIEGKNRTIFDFSNMRVAYHDSKFNLKHFAPRRATAVPDSQTNYLRQFSYYIHFGVNPILPNGEFNWFDLTAGIPPVQTGQLTLTGTWGAAAALGSAATVNAGYLEVHLVGVQLEDGEDASKAMLMALPSWSMTTPTPSATSTTFGTSYSIPGGGFLRSLMMMMTNGTNAPRDDQVLNSLRLYDQFGNRPIIEWGGRAGASEASGGDYKIAELFAQMQLAGAPYGEDLNGTIGVPVLTGLVDAEGLVNFPLHRLSDTVHPLFGANMNRVNTGDLRLDYGVADATGIQLDILFKRYELNPAHPANAMWL